MAGVYDAVQARSLRAEGSVARRQAVSRLSRYVLLGASLIGIVVLAAIYVMTAYNGLVKNKNLVAEGWSGIDVQLKRRADLIPNLVEAVKGYAAHETAAFEQVTAARSHALGAQTLDEKAAADGEMQAAVGKLFAVAEAYPQLRAVESFTQLQAELTGTEDQIASARRLYNANVQEYQTKREQFPGALLAGPFDPFGGDFTGGGFVAAGDFDNDGRVDVVILSSRRPPVVLRNESANGNHWLQLRLRGTKSNRDAVGARVKVVAGDLVQIDEVHSGRSYQSHFGTRLYFGLGPRGRVDRVEVRWIGGGTDVLASVPADRLLTITEGSDPAAEVWP